MIKWLFLTLVLFVAQLLPAQDSSSVSFRDRDFDFEGKTKMYKSSYRKIGGQRMQADLYLEEGAKLLTLSFEAGNLLVKSGPAFGYSAAGDTLFQTSFVNNKLNGEWISWFPDRQICDSGRLNDNIPDGTWKIWYPDGKLRFHVEFNSRLHTLLHAEMMRITERNFRSLTASASFGDGDLQYNKMVYEALRQAVYPDAIIGPAPLLSILSRLNFNQQAGTQSYIPPFLEGVLHGTFLSYYPDGQRRDSGMYVEGLRDGVWKEYLNAEQIHSEGFYRKGLRVKEWRYYNPEGRLLYIQRYSRYGKLKETIRTK